MGAPRAVRELAVSARGLVGIRGRDGGEMRDGWGGRAVLIKQVYSDQRQSLASLHISAS